MAKRHKTEYPGVFYRMVNRRGKPGKMQKIFYIVFKQDGKVFEEKVGLQYEDAMTPAKSSRIRAQRIEKKGFPLLTRIFSSSIKRIRSVPVGRGFSAMNSDFVSISMTGRNDYQNK